MKLMETIAVRMSSRQKVSVLRIDSEDFSGVVRKTKEELEKAGVKLTEDYIGRGILSLKQYYALPIFDPLNMHAVSDTIDPFWHAHILHTEQYMSFCDEAIGVYMHHDPLDHGVREEVAHVRFLYGYTRKVMDQLFASVDSEFFPHTLPDDALVCTHQNDIRYLSSSEQKFIFPIVSEAQKGFLHCS